MLFPDLYPAQIPPITSRAAFHFPKHIRLDVRVLIGVVDWLIFGVYLILREIVDTLLNSDDLALDEKPQQILNRKLHFPCMRLQLILVDLRHGKIILHLANLLKNVLVLGVSDG